MLGCSADGRGLWPLRTAVSPLRTDHRQAMAQSSGHARPFQGYSSEPTLQAATQASTDEGIWTGDGMDVQHAAPKRTRAPHNFFGLIYICTACMQDNGQRGVHSMYIYIHKATDLRMSALQYMHGPFRLSSVQRFELSIRFCG